MKNKYKLNIKWKSSHNKMIHNNNKTNCEGVFFEGGLIRPKPYLGLSLHYVLRQFRENNRLTELFLASCLLRCLLFFDIFIRQRNLDFRDAFLFMNSSVFKHSHLFVPHTSIPCDCSTSISSRFWEPGAHGK